MTDVLWPLVRELFDSVVDLPEAERAVHLGRAGVGPRVRAEVERMLSSDGAAIGFLESSSPLLEKALLPQMGTRLGHYELKRVIASGGMGTVFEAVQDEPRRAVALKTLRFGLTSPERLQRFRFEAEVLGSLRHPSIAQIFEAGTHEEAGEVVPFIAMELVPGARDILSYAREEGLELPERLALFLEVCEGVQHGHQKGVIHRDLKPGNILVDAEGRAKVIDFGVARATARAAPFGDVLTQTGQILGTLAYMAPEQLAGSPDVVDVRSDVYALGILLFELIEGRPPHELADKSPFEALRTIQEEPPRPSASTPRELGWILEKALAKEPERRYGSVSELAADLRRYLRGEPVLAGPPSVGYRLSKWIKRNPAKTAAAAIGVVAFVAIAWLLLQNLRVNRVLNAGNIALKAKTAEAEASAAQARENARVATDEKERADREAKAATRKADEVLRLSAFQRLDDLVRKADELWPVTPALIARYKLWLSEAGELVAELPSFVATLSELRGRGQGTSEEGTSDWTFDSDADRWWHAQLTKLVESLRAFTDGKTGLCSAGISPEHGWGIARRLEFAHTIEERSLTGPEAEARWDEALASIREDRAYAGLELTPQLGLLPLGPDPDSGLFEFAHLQSGEPAERGPDGRLILKDGFGLVLVLLPGGTFRMGAQRTDPSKPHYYPRAAADEGPVHEVRISPFFLSKYEMTQGQWERSTGRNPSYSRSGDRFPVEQVSWTQCDEVCRRLGLSLPSEAQWEYGTRAGTDSPWWSGEDPTLLVEVANLADRSYAAGGWLVDQGTEDWDDGASKTASVGRYAPNLFGLHDVHGNVYEWCLDWYERGYWRSDPVRIEVDPVRMEQRVSTDRVAAGGSFKDGALVARSSPRLLSPAEFSDSFLGCRPARSIAP